MKRGPTPSDDELLELFEASRENASDLLADARTLAEAGSWPRAHALATLAFEELAKSHLCIVTFVLGGEDAEPFRKAFQEHASKLMYALAFDGLSQYDAVDGVREFGARAKSEALRTHQRRLRGMYVDYENGQVQRPSQVTEGMAWELITAVERSLAVSQRAKVGGEFETALVTTKAISDAFTIRSETGLDDYDWSEALQDAREWAETLSDPQRPFGQP
jgi:AbiV family abortive infection protein